MGKSTNLTLKNESTQKKIIIVTYVDATLVRGSLQMTLSGCLFDSHKPRQVLILRQSFSKYFKLA